MAYNNDFRHVNIRDAGTDLAAIYSRVGGSRLEFCERALAVLPTATLSVLLLVFTALDAQKSALTSS